MEEPAPSRHGRTNAPSAPLVVSVVVPFHNGRKYLPGLLDSLHGQTLAPDRFEIILVDDGSTDGSGLSLAEYRQRRAGPPALITITALENCGSYAARNLGIARARAAALAFTDVDCRPEPGWLENGLMALKQAPRVAGAIRLDQSSPPALAELIDASRFLRQRHFVAEGFGATANLFVRREVFDRVGTFDGRLRSGGDHEFGRRAAAAGLDIAFAEDAVVGHRCRSSVPALLRKAERVGFGFGQSLRLNGVRVGEVMARAADRASLGTGRELAGTWQELSRTQRAAVAACHFLMGGFTAAGVARGFLSRPGS